MLVIIALVANMPSEYKFLWLSFNNKQLKATFCTRRFDYYLIFFNDLEGFGFSVSCLCFCVETLLTCTWLFCLSVCSLFKTIYKMSVLWRKETVENFWFSVGSILLARSITVTLFLYLLQLRTENFLKTEP